MKVIEIKDVKARVMNDMKVEIFQKDKRDYNGKKVIIWAPECSMNAMECLGERSGHDHKEGLSVR